MFKNPPLTSGGPAPEYRRGGSTPTKKPGDSRALVNGPSTGYFFFFFSGSTVAEVLMFFSFL
jgi:hypothetical protein